MCIQFTSNAARAANSVPTQNEMDKNVLGDIWKRSRSSPCFKTWSLPPPSEVSCVTEQLQTDPMGWNWRCECLEWSATTWETREKDKWPPVQALTSSRCDPLLPTQIHTQRINHRQIQIMLIIKRSHKNPDTHGCFHIWHFSSLVTNVIPVVYSASDSIYVIFPSAFKFRSQFEHCLILKYCSENIQTLLFSQQRAALS